MDAVVPGAGCWRSSSRTTRRPRRAAAAPGCGGCCGIYFMQQWFNLSDPAMEDALYDSESMRRFAGIDLAADLVAGRDRDDPALSPPAGETPLAEQLVRRGARRSCRKEAAAQIRTIVDATIIAARRRPRSRRRTRPGDEADAQGPAVHFGMKLHVAPDPAGLAAQRGDRPGLGGRTYARLGKSCCSGQERSSSVTRLTGPKTTAALRHAGIRYRVNRRATAGGAS